MTYQLISPPCSLDFTALSKQELKKYNDWVIAILPERLEILRSCVNASAGYNSWMADFDPASLAGLGDWFASQVVTRDRTQSEVRAIEARLKFPIDVPNEELTDETVSKAIDVGMYFGMVLLKNHPSLRWDFKTDNKRFADYGQPVIVGFGAAILNPVRIAVTLAYGVVAGTQSGSRLGQVYKFWSEQVGG
ncbi:hypothetical protein WCQ02_39465 [Paraburkholderia tropica]|uniref:DUF2313 domain-containing protein n=1 Tax=Paraburkholderia tropica TaxID=92647 RepID=A0ABX5MBC7_9BURK|nr:hypothetical protein [Paraburkholderia tropica]PXX04222.1 hypothetical protein C7400_14716 [Paraburkholderia tropica]PZW69508.1 hypothetical protein C7399_14716 [Paraburkholderia tropica]QNB17260.1 hypothetical protein G5S35_37115 [Paraburkholderia tropica]